MSDQDQSVLLIVGGGIAAYKALELVRLFKKAGIGVTPILTASGAKFVTPLSLGVLAGEAARTELFSIEEEGEIDHISLSRSADLIVVAPATANLIARAANGHADDLATTVLLATDTPVLMAPAMNVRMWRHPAVVRNVAQLAADGVAFVSPGDGEMACGEFGPGRMAEPAEIFEAVVHQLSLSSRPSAAQSRDPAAAAERLGPGSSRRAPLVRDDNRGRAAVPDTHAIHDRLPLHGEGGHCDAASGWGAMPDPGLTGKSILVTAGPTHEPLDPVRYIANRSSGQQGYAIAAALARRGAKVTLVSGPTALPDPQGVTTIRVETAQEMLVVCQSALPADAAVMVAAVADWRPAEASEVKLKKTRGEGGSITLVENPDILKTLAARGDERPRLVIGFAAETGDLEAQARAKLTAKGCDWILANDVAEDGVMGGPDNTILLVTPESAQAWPKMPKAEVAECLADRIAAALA